MARPPVAEIPHTPETENGQKFTSPRGKVLQQLAKAPLF
jgi:hypothetical protein